TVGKFLEHVEFLLGLGQGPTGLFGTHRPQLDGRCHRSGHHQLPSLHPPAVVAVAQVRVIAPFVSFVKLYQFPDRDWATIVYASLDARAATDPRAGGIDGSIGRLRSRMLVLSVHFA